MKNKIEYHSIKEENKMAEYKQVSITTTTADRIDDIKAKFAELGTPIQPPAIIGMAINKLAKEMKA